MSLFHNTYNLQCWHVTEGKANPEQAWTGHEGFRSWGSQIYRNQHTKVVRLPALHTGCLHIPGDTPSTHFYYRLSWLQGPSLAGRIKSIKNSNDAIQYQAPHATKPTQYLITCYEQQVNAWNNNSFSKHFEFLLLMCCDLHFTAGSRRGKLLADTFVLNKIHLHMWDGLPAHQICFNVAHLYFESAKVKKYERC